MEGKKKTAEKTTNQAIKLKGNTKKYIPKKGNWKPTNKKKNQWLKENGYTLGEDYYHDKGGKNIMRHDVYDQDGNVVGRLERNDRVDGKVVPVHVHLNSDDENVHHWFND